MEEAWIVRGRIALASAGGRAILHAAETKAAEMGIPQCIAIVDAGGDLLAFSRMDGARAGSVEIAITKARSAARRRRPTADEAGGDMLASVRLGLASHMNVTGVGGGVPVVIEGQIVGGIGVSSGTPDEDTVVAMAGLAVLVA